MKTKSKRRRAQGDASEFCRTCALMPLLPRRRDGWWLNASRFTPDRPEWGPYESRSAAIAARGSFLRSRNKQQIEEARAARLFGSMGN